MKHLAMVAVALAAVGCMNDRTYMDPVQNLSGTGTDNALRLSDGSLRGDFGPRTDIDGPAVAEGSSSLGSNSSTVTVTRAEQGRGTGMVILWTNNVLLEQLETGEHPFSYDAESLDTPSLAANVCSGPDGGSIDYDRPADQGTLVVTETPQGREIAVHTETVVDETTGETEVSDTSFIISSAR